MVEIEEYQEMEEGAKGNGVMYVGLEYCRVSSEEWALVCS